MRAVFQFVHRIYSCKYMNVSCTLYNQIMCIPPLKLQTDTLEEASYNISKHKDTFLNIN